MIEEGQGICQQRKWRASAIKGKPLPWDARLPADGHGAAAKKRAHARHDRAREICNRCPIIDACERYLAAAERAGIRVDGVVAGRYSDAPTYGWMTGPKNMPTGNEEGRQTTCRACREPMWPQIISDEKARQRGGKKHVGEGLCNQCYPHFARHVRRRM